MTVEISVHGCDDSTIVQMKVTEEEAAFLDKVAELITKNGGGCRPTMTSNQVIILENHKQ